MRRGVDRSRGLFGVANDVARECRERTAFVWVGVAEQACCYGCLVSQVSTVVDRLIEVMWVRSSNNPSNVGAEGHAGGLLLLPTPPCNKGTYPVIPTIPVDE